MSRAGMSRARLGAAIGLALALLSGCNKKISLPVVTNLRPELQLTQAPVATTSPYFYSYEVRWTGYDPDGRVDHYAYALDPPPPPATDTGWVITTENRHKFTFESNDPESLGTVTSPGGYHTLVMKAIDNQGLASPVASRSFFSYTVAPEVRITQPIPNRLLHPLLPPSPTFRWTGFDADGVSSQKPVKYKFRLFKDGVGGFSVQNISAFFDSLRHAYPPSFATWDSSASDTFFQYRGLTPSGTYVFAVAGIDEAGAYSPAWSFDSNLLYFFVDFPVVYGPRITMFGDFFNYTYESPGYLNDPRRYLFLEIPAQAPIRINWSASAGQNASMTGYRWAMDIDRLDDETKRTGPDDVKHWSDLFLSNTSTTVGPFGSSDSSHTFFVEALENTGFKSLGIISFRVVQPDFQHDLLFVDDSSFPVDENVVGTDSLRAPIGSEWPSAAELDTFMFARGGKHWRYYPPGSLSPPGIFNGYRFDTLSTRFLPTPFVALSTLAQYRHVVWYCDQAGAPGSPTPALRYMSGSGRQNNLSTYVRMGGNAWLMGGGGAFNSLYPFNSRLNDTGGAAVFSGAAGELIRGRMMYDIAHWQSEITVFPAQGAIHPAGRLGGWPGAPDYSSLPSALLPRSFATDPLWPLRSSNAFYRSDYYAEYLSKPNKTSEDLDPDPDVTLPGPPLDTLYLVVGNRGDGMPVMTYYHGVENQPFLFSGFPLWHFRRPQAIQLADWVLQTLWHLPRDPVSRGVASP